MSEEEFLYTNLDSIKKIKKQVDGHVIKLNKKNEIENRYEFLSWFRTIQIKDNIEKKLELNFWLWTEENPTTQNNSYSITLTEWTKTYEKPFKDKLPDDDDLNYSDEDNPISREDFIDCGLDKKNLDVFASMIFQYVNLGGDLEDFKNPPEIF
jgi:hypothetical protein